MASGGISASGVGSGIDILGLVDQLVAAERQRPEQLLNQRESALEDQISAIGKLKSALSTFQDSLASLSTLDKFVVYSGSSSDESIATVTANSEAVAGSFDIELNTASGHQLASANKLITNTGFADPDTTAVGTGDITINNANGDSFTVNISSGNDTLNDIRDAINNDTDNFGVSATVLTVSDGLGGTESKLVLTAENSGEDYALTVTAPTITAVESANLSEITPGQNAIFTVDGQTVNSASNSVSGVISGVDIELKGEGTTTLSITTDEEAIIDNVQAFVDAFNTMQAIFKETTAYNGGDPAPLFTDTSIKALNSNIKDILVSSITTTQGIYSSLAQIGITTNDDGDLELDQTELKAALANDSSSVAEIFTNSDGIAAQFDAKLEQYTQFAGLLDSKTESLNTRKNLIDDARGRMDYRLGKMEDRLRAQFIAMDALVQSLNSTGSFLTQQLANLPGTTRKNS